MAYDKEKAHEYYLKYRKKGLKKGRKKGKGKKAASASLLGTSVSGLNPAGKIQAGLIKENMKKEMNAALSKASTQEEKDKIRADYSMKAQEQIAALKNNPQYAAPQKAKAAKATKAAKGSAEKSGKAEKASAASVSAANQKAIRTIRNQLEILQKFTKTATPERKREMLNVMQALLDTLKAMKNG
jgi:hypothetical protein